MDATAAGAGWQRCSKKRSVGKRSTYYPWQKWSADGSLERVWQPSIHLIRSELDLSQLNPDGGHAIAKKGGECVAYQHRKHAKTSNLLPITDAHGYGLASTGIIAATITMRFV